MAKFFVTCTGCMYNLDWSQSISVHVTKKFSALSQIRQDGTEIPLCIWSQDVEEKDIPEYERKCLYALIRLMEKQDFVYETSFLSDAKTFAIATNSKNVLYVDES